MRAILVLLLLVSACGADPPCDAAAYFVAGTHLSSFRCADPATPMCFDGTDTLTVTQDGTAMAPGNTVSFTDDVGGSFTGKLCGSTFTWSGRGMGFAEAGTWTFTSADRFTKTTAFDPDDGSGRGCCIGEGGRMGAVQPGMPATCPALGCSPP